MPTYQLDRDITEATGTQTFTVEAENESEARKKFANGEGKFISQEFSADELAPVDECDVYEIE